MIKQTLLNFKFKRTDEKLTPHAGATLFTEFMLAFGVKKLIQRIMPSPGSNRGYDAWQYIHPIVLMLLAGGRHIDDLREIAEDKALRESTGMGKVPIQEVSDAYKYEDIFNETVFEKLKAKEEELTGQQSDALSQKIMEKREEYNELNPELIEERKKINIRSSYDEREIIRDSMECPACGNASFCVLKLYTESEDDLSGQFLTVGRCFVCKLELSEDELKNTGML
ncbi:hypothetical protein [Thermodesulfovibrio hydrogeniphilus]